MTLLSQMLEQKHAMTYFYNDPRNTSRATCHCERLGCDASRFTALPGAAPVTQKAYCQLCNLSRTRYCRPGPSYTLTLVYLHSPISYQRSGEQRPPRVPARDG